MINLCFERGLDRQGGIQVYAVELKSKTYKFGRYSVKVLIVSNIPNLSEKSKTEDQILIGYVPMSNVVMKIYSGDKVSHFSI